MGATLKIHIQNFQKKKKKIEQKANCSFMKTTSSLIFVVFKGVCISFGSLPLLIIN